MRHAFAGIFNMPVGVPFEDTPTQLEETKGPSPKVGGRRGGGGGIGSECLSQVVPQRRTENRFTGATRLARGTYRQQQTKSNKQKANNIQGTGILSSICLSPLEKQRARLRFRLNTKIQFICLESLLGAVEQERVSHRAHSFENEPDGIPLRTPARMDGVLSPGLNPDRRSKKQHVRQEICPRHCPCVPSLRGCRPCTAPSPWSLSQIEVRDPVLAESKPIG